MISTRRCHICQAEAIGRCYACGELFCESHGRINCSRCATAIAAGDARTDRITESLPAGGASQGGKPVRPGWWRPQPAEDYEPPACQECQGLARYQCINCGNRYCREHAGSSGLCALCERSRRGGNIFLVILFFVLTGLTLWGLFRSTSL
jgi:hypothetical protein